MSIANTAQVATRLALAGTLTAGALVFGAGPAQARAAIIVEPGSALRTAGNKITCHQFVSERGGSDLDNYRAEPRLQEKIVERQRRYYRKATYRYYKQFGRTRRVLKTLPGWVYPPDKVYWSTVGGLAKGTHPNREVRLFAKRPTPGVVYNSKPAEWDPSTGRYENPINPRTGRPEPGKWAFTRNNPPGQQTVRCVLFFSGRATDDTGTRYNFSVTKIGGERRF